MTHQIYPGLRVQTLGGEQDTDPNGAERQTAPGTWGHISQLNHGDHWDVVFPNHAWVVLTEAELLDPSQYRLAEPQTLEQCALALQYGQTTLELTHLVPPLAGIAQTLLGNLDELFALIRSNEQLREDATDLLQTVRSASDRWDKYDQEDAPTLGDALTRLAGRKFPWEIPEPPAAPNTGSYATQLPEGDLLAHGWQLANANIKAAFPDAVFMRCLGGGGSPYVSYGLTIVRNDDGTWTPMHGNVKMEQVQSPEAAATALMEYWNKLPDCHKLAARL